MILTVRWRALFAVLKDAWPTWPIWLAVVWIALAFTAGWLLSTTLSAAVRYAGMILQFLGLVTVAIGLSQMRRLFGRPSLIARVFGWLERLAAAFGRPKSYTLEASAGSYVVVGEEARLVRGVGPGASVEQRLSILEENVSHLRDEVDTKVQGLRQEVATVKESIQRESQERQAGDQELRRTIEEVAIGGLHLETVGLVWLILGVVGTSIPDEIAAWLIITSSYILSVIAGAAAGRGGGLV